MAYRRNTCHLLQGLLSGIIRHNGYPELAVCVTKLEHPPYASFFISCPSSLTLAFLQLRGCLFREASRRVAKPDKREGQEARKSSGCG